MNSRVDTGWVKPPTQITGLDHLGVQSPCIQVYSDQLPGITNVTDRARYYSFYPWLLVRFDQQGWRSADEVKTMLRRAECLLSLIGLYHADCFDGPVDDHQTAMVGNGVLSGALEHLREGRPTKLSDYAHQEDAANRYFKNPYGGMGQYYFGALVGLGLLAGDSPAEARVPEETGALLARLTGQSVPGDLFIETLGVDVISLDRLSELVPFCPCQLKLAVQERDALVEVMLRGWSALYQGEEPSAEEIENSAARARSLAYLCLLAQAASEQACELDMATYRAMIYSRHDAAQQLIETPAALRDCVMGWQVYQRNELLSVALQGLLFSLLRAGELSPGGFRRFATTGGLSRWFWRDSVGATWLESADTSNTQQLTQRLAEQLPALADWQHEGHEIQAMLRIVRLTRQAAVGPDDLNALLNDCLIVLAAVLSRPENQVGYDRYQFPENYLDYYPVNLTSVLREWQEGVGLLPPVDGLIRLTQDYCLDTHLRVAMRKLSQQGQNTFRFEPSEIGLKLNAIPRVAHTTPRFKQAVRILLDLGLLEQRESLTQVTASGWAFVERVK